MVNNKNLEKFIISSYGVKNIISEEYMFFHINSEWDDFIGNYEEIYRFENSEISKDYIKICRDKGKFLKNIDMCLFDYLYYFTFISDIIFDDLLLTYQLKEISFYFRIDSKLHYKNYENKVNILNTSFDTLKIKIYQLI